MNETLPVDDATRRQITAARPDRSTWLSANAGSGKTRVLTDRVARLLLDGASPQHVLCLTFTKAAASEMQNRLFRRLGEWAMMEEGALRGELAAMGVRGEIKARQLAHARRLFARAIETPGGLRVQTIHSFCATLLRRFPLEARVSPAFREMDDRAAERLRADCVEELALERPDLMAELARHYTGDDLDKLCQSITQGRDAFGDLDEAALCEGLGIDPDDTPETLRARAFVGGEADLAKAVRDCLKDQSKTYAGFAADLCALDLETPTAATFAALKKLFLYAADDSSKSRNFPQSKHTKAVDALAPVADDLHAFMDRVAEATEALKAHDCLMRTRALHGFAQGFLPLYAARKEARGWLDFDDLILRARDLLTDASVAQWVLFRLDGGIDHILVDEAQDTSPAQWAVVSALAQEFASGLGARDTQRTLFVVGDVKQSIYSFQGADPAEFERMYADFAERLGEGGLQRAELEHSFRSSPAVLGAVDATFQDSALTPVRHIAFHGNLPGRVDLWPVVEPDEGEPAPDWHDPVDRVSPRDKDVRLAEAVADHLALLMREGATIPDKDGRHRPMTAGDVLILVRRRGILFQQLIRACKARGLDIAGADRLQLCEELAVKDLRAVLSFLVTPEDCLSLAAALRSPLFGLTEAQLYDLAATRESKRLWPALNARAADFPEAHAILTDLRREADFLRPFELLERLLTRHGGRARLIGRLGREAEDAVDALLTLAMDYERADIPSLTGFLAWLDAADVEIKRQPEGAGARLRVMTVHGAKGLEAPVVILPDTVAARAGHPRDLVPTEDGTPLWGMSKGDAPALMAEARARAEAAEAAERQRLLYVAMTRAERWLIVCGAGSQRDADASWHGEVARGLARLDCAPLVTPFGPGLRHATPGWDDAPPAALAPTPGDAPAVLPDWCDARAELPPEAAPVLSPSKLGGAKALAGEGDPDALEHGTWLHALLEHLPRAPEAAWPDLARRIVPEPHAEALLKEAACVLQEPDLARVMAKPCLREVDVTARVGGRAMLGTIDRLIVEPGRVLAIDYKSNRTVPDVPETVPEGLLRQMGAYRAALMEIYPDREVEVALLWTRVPALMPLPAALVAQALAQALP